MTTKLKLSFSILSMLYFCNLSYSQSDVAGPTGHLRVPGYFVGWSPGLGSVAGPLDIRNDFTQPIDFWTNSFRRMRITDGGSGQNLGRIAMGNNLPTNFTPLSRLHLHQDAGINSIRFTTNNMAGGTGLQVGYDATSNTQNQQYAQVLNRVKNKPLLVK